MCTRADSRRRDSPRQEQSEQQRASHSSDLGTIGELALASQDTVFRSGVMLRFDATRTETHQNIIRRLELYQTGPTLECKVGIGSRS